MTSPAEGPLAAERLTLLQAASTGDWEAAERALARAAASEGQSASQLLASSRSGAAGNTALHLAAIQGHLAVVRGLVAALQSEGVPLRVQSAASTVASLVDARNRQGDTPLLFALSAGQLGAASVLLKAGASVAARNREGISCAHAAAGHAHAAALQLLQRHTGPKAWTQLLALVDRQKRTPLHYAAAAGSEQVVSLLVQAPPGLDVFAVSSSGRTALQDAQHAGHDGCSRIIRARMEAATAAADAAATELMAQAGPGSFDRRGSSPRRKHQPPPSPLQQSPKQAKQAPRGAAAGGSIEQAEPVHAAPPQQQRPACPQQAPAREHSPQQPSSSQVEKDAKGWTQVSAAKRRQQAAAAAAADKQAQVRHAPGRNGVRAQQLARAAQAEAPNQLQQQQQQLQQQQQQLQQQQQQPQQAPPPQQQPPQPPQQPPPQPPQPPPLPPQPPQQPPQQQPQQPPPPLPPQKQQQQQPNGRPSYSQAAQLAHRPWRKQPPQPAELQPSSEPAAEPDGDAPLPGWWDEALAALSCAAPAAAELDIRPQHVLGLRLGELSVAQLECLELIHRASLARVAEASREAALAQHDQEAAERAARAREIAVLAATLAAGAAT